MSIFDGFKNLFKRGEAIKQRKTIVKAPTSAPKKTETTAPAEVETQAVKLSTPDTTGDAYRILSRPVLSEKAVHGESVGTYTFVVDRRVKKLNIKDAISRVYGVRPISIRMMNVEGKRVRFGKSLGKRQDYKKAIVKLPKGKTMSIHEGV